MATPPPPPLVDAESEYLAAIESSNKRLWLLFQTTAGTVAKLYRDGNQLQNGANSSSGSSSADPLWASFQACAGSLTQYYKDTLDAMQTVQDKAVQYGYQKRRREMANLRAAAMRSKKAAASQRYAGCGQQIGAAAVGGAPAALGDGSNLLSESDAAARALEFELEKTMLSDGGGADLSSSPLRTLKRRPPPTDDVLEAIFIKRARQS